MRTASPTPIPGQPRAAADAADLTGALELIQLLAQTLVPALSLSIRSLSDILYGQDQLPTSLNGPNNAVSVFQAQAAGTGTQTLDQYVSEQQGRVAELVSILDVVLAAQQTAAGGPAAAQPRASSPATASPRRRPGHGQRSGADLQRARPARHRRQAGHRHGHGRLARHADQRAGDHGDQAADRHLKRQRADHFLVGHRPATRLVDQRKTGKVTGKPTKTGTFAVTVKATDTVGSSGHSSGQATFSWVITSKAPPVCGTQLIGDGGFESGLAPWSATSGVRIAGSRRRRRSPGSGWPGWAGGPRRARTRCPRR